MKLIIDIPEESFNDCKLRVELGVATGLETVIAKGTSYEERQGGGYLNIKEGGKICEE